MIDQDAPRRRLLVVDDDEGLREIFIFTMKMAGWEVASAPDGVAALAALAEFKPDVIALDLMMPRMNGVQFCGKLSEASIRVPIIIVSAMWDSVDEPVMRQDPNIVGFLHKPLRYPTLARSIGKLLAA